MKESIDTSESKPRLVWHPLVHRRFSEELHYFLISTTMYSSTFKDQLRRILSDIGATGFCMYEIFGNYDILLRVWLTNASRPKFVQYAEDSQDIAGIEEFMVQGFNVLWHESGNTVTAPSEDDLRNLSPDVVQKAQLGQLPRSKINSLLSRNLLLSRNIAFSKEEYKFFVLMSYPAGVPVRDFEITEYLRQFIGRQEAFEKISAYWGIGFTRYLIKAVSRNFYDISRFVLALISEFRLMKIQTNTIVVADKEPHESDNITFPRSIAAGERLTVESLVPELYDQTDINLLEQDLLESKILECKDAFTNDDDGILHDTFRLIISKNAEELATRLQMYLSGFERFLRDSFTSYTVALCRDASSSEAVSPDKVMRNAYKSRGVSESKKASLGEWIELYRCVLTATVSDESNWVAEHNRILKTATTWRNRFAHADYGDIVCNWNELIDFISEFIPVKKQIVALMA